MSTLLILIVIIALVFDFLNGMNDAANSIATIVSTKVLSPTAAVMWAALFNFAAVFVFGVPVAKTITKGIINPDIMTLDLLFCALVSAVLWVWSCTKMGLPISVSHALIGGLIGPALVAAGPSSLVSAGIMKVTIFIVVSPLVGMVLSYFIMILVMLIFKRSRPARVDKGFRVMQLFSSAVFSLGHGSNDAQKTMGIITGALIAGNVIDKTDGIPFWVIGAAYTAIALGTLTGGRNVIRTLGQNLTDLKPVQGFCAESAGAVSVIMSSMFGIPVSTTHTITGSIVGVGLTRRVSAIRWQVAGKIVWAWVLTIPSTIAVSAIFYWVYMFVKSFL